MAVLSDLETNKLFVGDINVRKSVGDITELKLSIEEKGILQPLLVRPLKNRFEIVVGSRRYEAAKSLGLRKVPVIIRPMSDTEAVSLSLVENIQRSDLELEEEAEGVLRLMKLDPKRFAKREISCESAGPFGERRSRAPRRLRVNFQTSRERYADSRSESPA